MGEAICFVERLKTQIKVAMGVANSDVVLTNKDLFDSISNGLKVCQ